jgi:hypothetical protein
LIIHCHGNHNFELTSKLNKACYAIRVIKHLCLWMYWKWCIFLTDTQLCHTVLFLGGNSHHSNSIFKIKKIIIIIANTGRRDSCHQLYKQLQILPLPFQYIFSLLVFVNKNRGLFPSNSEIHYINTRYNYNLHLPSTNLTFLQKGVLYSGSGIYNHLPLNIKMLSNDTKCLKSTLKSYLTEHTFYSLDEYYQSAS